MNKSQYESIKVGTKVRITNVASIVFGSIYFNNGDVVECVGFRWEDEALFRGTKTRGNMTILRSEMHAIELVDEPTSSRPKVGDRVRILEAGRREFMKGDFGIIVKDDRTHIPFKVERLDGSDFAWFREDDIEKVNAYSYSNPPKEGDIVVVIANTNLSRNAVGDIGKVGGRSGHTVKVDVPGKTTGNGNSTMLHEIRPATDAEKAQYEENVRGLIRLRSEGTKSSTKFTVGTKVKVVSAPGRLCVGDIGTVEEVESHSVLPYKVVRADETHEWFFEDEIKRADGRYEWFHEDEVELVKDEPLKEGDYITIDTRETSTDITEGRAYKVRKRYDGKLYFVDDAKDERVYPILEGWYTKVKPPVKAPINQELIPENGDIVRILDAVYGSEIEIGSLTEVTHADGTPYPKVRYSGGKDEYAKVEVVVRKKDRLDVF